MTANAVSKDELVRHLAERILVRIAPSDVHGVGVVSLYDLPAGQKMYLDDMPQVYQIPVEYLQTLPKEAQSVVLERWPRVFEGSGFVYPDARYQAYCNHSDDPSYDLDTDTLTRAVAAGEEITEDYRRIVGWERAFPRLVDNKEGE